jgi:hypothetical protein
MDGRAQCVSAEQIIGYVRDTGCTLVGLGGIVWQIYTGDMTAVGMGTCMGLLGITGAINVRQLLPQTNSPRGGAGSSSSSPPRASRSRSPARSERDA